ncbi:MAG: iron-containing alcohol dehydrogenase [Lachnospiraceae bacterium]
MNFYIPTKIHVQKNCVSTYKTELASFGTKALIVTGANSSKQNGSLKDVTEALSTQGVLYVIFDSIEQNPSLENVAKAAQIGKDENVDYVIGIGGGSPMDAAKAIAVLIANPGKQAKDLYDPTPLKALPVVEVPTTAGTGSEATPYAILTIHDEQTKRSMAQKVFPELALVDPGYLNFSNKDLLVNTAIDALAHLIESYLNTNADPFNRMLSEYGLDLWGSIKEILLIEEDPTEEEAETLALASTIAGMAISHTGTSLPHGMSYYLTYEKGIPHGNAVGIFLPAFIDLYEDRSQVKTVLRLLEFRNEKSFFKFIDSLFDVIEIEQDELDRYVDGMLSNEKKLANYPFTMTRETMELLFVNSVSVEKKKLFTFFKKNKKEQPAEKVEAVIEPKKKSEEEQLAELRAEQEKAREKAEQKKEEVKKKAMEQEKVEKEKAYREAREKALMAREQAAKEAAEAKKQASIAKEETDKTTVIPNVQKGKQEQFTKKAKSVGRSLFAPQPKEEIKTVKQEKKVVEPAKVEEVIKVEKPKKVEPKVVEPKIAVNVSKPEINNPLESIKRAQAAAEAERKAREEVEKAAQMAAEEAKKAEEAAKAAAAARAQAAARAEELQRRLAEAEKRAAEAKKAIESLKDE